MDAILAAVGRTYARVRGRAVAVRRTSSIDLALEPGFCITAIRVVSEQRPQALAFGLAGQRPDITVSWNPLGRDAGFLEPFAEALDHFLMLRLDARKTPRVWVANDATLELLDVLGHRYERNSQATPTLRRMGQQCRQLALEATMEGQQAVVVATRLLQDHFLTGQSAVEDGHLGAMLAWIDPPAGQAAGPVADELALQPVAAMLRRDEDDRAEALRREAKAGNLASRAELEALLEEAALREWDLLMTARSAFLAHGFEQAAPISALSTASLKRLEWKIRNQASTPTRTLALVELLESREDAIAHADVFHLRADSTRRAQAVLEGRAFVASVERAVQPRSSRSPCTLELKCAQAVLRLRPGSAVQTADGTLEGRVIALDEDPTDGAHLITVSLTRGFRSVPDRGADTEWITEVAVDMGFQRGRVRQRVLAAQPDLIFGNALPAPRPRQRVQGDLLTRAQGLRQ